MEAVLISHHFAAGRVTETKNHIVFSHMKDEESVFTDNEEVTITRRVWDDLGNPDRIVVSVMRDSLA